ncbi:MAG: hypothetical protein ACM3VZ_07445 [Acidobacteriota bacterium]
MFHPKLQRVPLAVAAFIACASAHAGYSSPDGMFSLSGFGTLGYAKSSTDDALYNYRGQGGGAGKDGSLGTDSKVGIQGTYKVTPTLQGTAQVMSKLTPDGDYAPGIEWAFAKWQAMPALSFRAGRMGAPYFMLSDFREVNYAVTSVRPSMDVYSQVAVTTFEGADATYQINAGPATINSTLWLGRSQAPYALDLPQNRSPSNINIKNIVGLNVTAELDNGLSLRVGHAAGKLTVSSEGSTRIAQGAAALAAAYAGVPSTAQQYMDVYNALTAKDKDATFTGVGFSYDEGSWVASGEWTRRKTKTYIADTTGISALVGYRFGSVTPFVGYSKLKTDHRHSSVAPVASGTTSPQAQVYLGSRFVMDTQKVDEKTASIGARWDVRSNVALKAQFDRISKPADSSGLFLIPMNTAIATGNSWVNNARKVNILSVSMDFVF